MMGVFFGVKWKTYGKLENCNEHGISAYFFFWLDLMGQVTYEIPSYFRVAFVVGILGTPTHYPRTQRW